MKENISSKENLNNLGAAMNQSNLEELTSYYKLPSTLDLFYDIAVKKIDLKELKEFKILGR